MSTSRAGRLTGYAACGCALLFAMVSLYWAVGGTVGLETVGSGAVELSESGGVAIRLALLFVTALKLAGAFLALALIQPFRWGLRIPRWMLLIAGGGGAGLLVLYGGGQILIQLLVKEGVITAPVDMDWQGFYGHLYLWDPWFLLWGVLLGATTLSYMRRTTRSVARVDPPSGLR